METTAGDGGTSATRVGPAGDPLPDRLIAYYGAIDAAHFEAVAHACSERILYAVPVPGTIETDPRMETHGRAQLVDRLRARGAWPRVHDVALCVRDGASCLVEGRSLDSSTGEPLASFAASVQLDSDGRIDRYLAYACSPAIAERPADAVGVPLGRGSTPDDAAAVLDRYFAALDRGAFAAAADCFSEDVRYSHPPYKHTGIDGNRRVDFRGRNELVEAFTRRGRQSFDHRILASVQRGPHCLIEGIVEGLPGGGTGSFVSSLTLDGEGLIRRYVSFYCEPGVRRI